MTNVVIALTTRNEPDQSKRRTTPEYELPWRGMIDRSGDAQMDDAREERHANAGCRADSLARD